IVLSLKSDGANANPQPTTISVAARTSLDKVDQNRPVLMMDPLPANPFQYLSDSSEGLGCGKHATSASVDAAPRRQPPQHRLADPAPHVRSSPAMRSP